MAMQTVLYPSRDLEASKRVFTALLGTGPTTDEPYYVGYQVGDQQFGLVPNGHDNGMTGPVGHFHVDDIAETVKALIEAGGTEKQAVHDVGGGRLVAIVDDPDGNPIGLIQSPW